MNILAIVMEGGFVSSVVSDQPAAFQRTHVIVVDYDTDDLDERDITGVRQVDGSMSKASVAAASVEEATIDLQPLLGSCGIYSSALSQITNADRAENGRLCIQAVSDRDDEPPQELVTDALADIMHYCGANDVGFEQCLTMAKSHYQAETTGGYNEATGGHNYVRNDE